MISVIVMIPGSLKQENDVVDGDASYVDFVEHGPELIPECQLSPKPKQDRESGGGK